MSGSHDPYRPARCLFGGRVLGCTKHPLEVAANRQLKLASKITLGKRCEHGQAFDQRGFEPMAQ